MCRVLPHCRGRLRAPWHVSTLACELYSMQNMWGRCDPCRNCEYRRQGPCQTRERDWRWDRGSSSFNCTAASSECGSLFLVAEQHHKHTLVRRGANHDLLHKPCTPGLSRRISDGVAPRAI